MLRLPWVLGLLLASSAAYGAKPSMMLFPLEFKREPARFTKADREALRVDAERLLRVAGVELADFAKGDTALAELKRTDCEREDACLQQLAQKAETLYALYASLDFTLEGQVVATGRVVRDDGKGMSPTESVSLPLAGSALRAAASSVLAGLYEKLKVGGLPAVREVEQTPEKSVGPTKPEAVVMAPMAPPWPTELRGPGPVTKGLVFGGAGLAVVGAILAAAGAGIGGAAPLVDVGSQRFAQSAEAASQLAAGRTLTGGGLVGLGVGAVAAAIGVVQWVTVSGAAQVALVPTSQGGVLTMGGSF